MPRGACLASTPLLFTSRHIPPRALIPRTPRRRQSLAPKPWTPRRSRSAAVEPTAWRWRALPCWDSSRAAATGCSTRLPSHAAAVAANTPFRRRISRWTSRAPVKNPGYIHSMRLRSLLGAALLIFAAAFALGARAQDKLVEYRLGPGDSIRISVFDNPNLTLETRVGENGIITYPLIGRVRIGGLTIPLAEQTIAKALADGNFIKQPQVSILSLQMRSNQVSVLGLVNRAGRFPLETFNVRVSEMIAIAGGIAPTGADVAIVMGERAGKPFRKEIDIPALFLYNKHDDDVTVAPGDVIYVNRAPLFYIYGEVQRPGSYRVDRGMTVRQALAQGGGPTQRGTERGLRMHRRGPSNQLEATSPRLDDPVQPGDVFYVGDSLF